MSRHIKCCEKADAQRMSDDNVFQRQTGEYGYEAISFSIMNITTHPAIFLAQKNITANCGAREDGRYQNIRRTSSADELFAIALKGVCHCCGGYVNFSHD